MFQGVRIASWITQCTTYVSVGEGHGGGGTDVSNWPSLGFWPGPRPGWPYFGRGRDMAVLGFWPGPGLLKKKEDKNIMIFSLLKMCNTLCNNLLHKSWKSRPKSGIGCTPRRSVPSLQPSWIWVRGTGGSWKMTMIVTGAIKVLNMTLVIQRWKLSRNVSKHNRSFKSRDILFSYLIAIICIKYAKSLQEGLTWFIVARLLLIYY